MHYSLPEYDSLQNHKPTLSQRVNKGVLKAILFTYKYRFLEYFIATVVCAVLKSSASIFTSRSMDTISSGANIRDPQIFQTLCINFALIAAMNTSSSILSTFFAFRLKRVSIGIRSSLYSILQDRIIASNLLNSEKFTEGFLTNLIQIDAVEVSNLIEHISDLIDTVVNSIIACLYMAYLVGWKLLIMSMVVYQVSNLLFVFAYWLKYQFVKKYLQAKDRRMSLFTDVMKNFEFIKSRALENRFCVELFKRREKEVEHLGQFAMSLAAVRFSGDTARVMTILSIIFYFVNFESGISFGEFTAFNQVLHTACYKLLNVYYSFMFIFERVPNIQRMDLYFGTVETTRNDVELEEKDFGEKGSKEVVLSIQNGFFQWNNLRKDFGNSEKKSSQNTSGNLKKINPESSDQEAERQLLIKDKKKGDEDLASSKELQRFRLKEINLKILKGERIAVLGSSNSGKSSLLYSMIGEMPPVPRTDLPSDSEFKSEGDYCRIRRSGKVSFLSSNRWTVDDTIKNNICLGEPYDERRMLEALEASQLVHDVGYLSKGLDTVISDKGDTVSGGQRARIALARCFYHR